MKTQLLEKIRNRTAHLCVVGLGYVGLPLAVEFVRAGLRVTGIDVDTRNALRGTSDGARVEKF